MKYLKWVLMGALILYTTALLYAEVAFSQGYVRHYFTDISGPVFFYAVNTTLSVFLLWGIALLFAISIVCLEERRLKDRWFYASQVLMFSYLGLDDRFMLHEKIGGYIRSSDAWSLLAIAVTEVVLLCTLGHLLQRAIKVQRALLVAALLFALMIFCDVILPHDMILRLSVEDLSKTWAGVFLFLYAWHICCDEIATLKGHAARRAPSLREAEGSLTDG